MTTPQNPFEQNNGDNEFGQANSSPYGAGDAYGQDNASYSTPGEYPASDLSGYEAIGEKPNNYLIWAILSTIFCCLPAGIASIVFAAQVNGRWESGNHQGAVEASQKAKKWAIISAVLGIIFSVLYFVLIGAGVLSSDMTNA